MVWNSSMIQNVKKRKLFENILCLTKITNTLILTHSPSDMKSNHPMQNYIKISSNEGTVELTISHFYEWFVLLYNDCVWKIVQAVALRVPAEG